MATLVLGAIGGVIGGPIGAAIGAFIGQQADQIIFAPKGREGPRLADLKVQASTYGQQIPKLFGTMRVAGSVIWSTDLIEHRHKNGGGKGQPSVTSFSYSVSLAVALSARRIGAIRRIWADGNLLRGTSGRLNERGTLRIYTGGEDQPVDPLIAASVGMASASAYRGLAYVVLEGLDLASFGNRIPSLTFEVVADAAPQNSGQIGNALMGETARCVGQWPIEGYAASGDRLRDALSPLFEIDRVGLVSSGDDWRLAPANLTGAALPLGGFARAGRALGARDVTERRRKPLSALPGAIRLRHYEPARDYQTGQQSSAVAGGGAREDRLDLPAVLSASSARSLAAWLAAAASDGRETLVWQGDLATLALPVGGLILLEDGSQWRVSGRLVRDHLVQIELCRHQRTAPAIVGGDPGAAVTAPDWPDAEGVVRVFDLPNMELFAPTTPIVMMVAAADDDRWRGADCWFVAGEDAEPVGLGRLRSVAAMGVLDQPVAAGSAHLMDLGGRLYVRLENEAMALESADDSQLLAGANLAMLGSELFQFGRAELVAGEAQGGRLWCLSRLLRARGGQEIAPNHAAGTPFVLLGDAAMMALPASLAQRATNGFATVQWAERGDDQMQTVPVPATMMALKPLSPVHGRAMTNSLGGVELNWVRRSRVNGGWRDEVDLPLGESAERWHVSLSPPVAGLGPWECAEPRFLLLPDAVTLLPAGTSAEISQIGDIARSAALNIALP